VTQKVCAGAAFCFACVVAAATVVNFMLPAGKNIAASSERSAEDHFTKAFALGSATGPALPRVDATDMTLAPGPPPLESTSFPAEPVTVFGKPTQEESVHLPSLTGLHPSAEVEATDPPEASEAAISEARPAPVASPTRVAAPADSRAPNSKPTTSAPSPPPAQLQLPGAEIAALVARGDALIGSGDISSARLFYERAANAGEGGAALRLGVTFDPAFLDAAHLHMWGDAAKATSWYQRALELGEVEAAVPLNRRKSVSK
jgi:hypothetical protein